MWNFTVDDETFWARGRYWGAYISGTGTRSRSASDAGKESRRTDVRVGLSRDHGEDQGWRQAGVAASHRLLTFFSCVLVGERHARQILSSSTACLLQVRVLYLRRERQWANGHMAVSLTYSIQRTMRRESHPKDHPPRLNCTTASQCRWYHVTASPSYMHDEDTQRHYEVATLPSPRPPVSPFLASPARSVAATRDKCGTGLSHIPRHSFASRSLAPWTRSFKHEKRW